MTTFPIIAAILAFVAFAAWFYFRNLAAAKSSIIIADAPVVIPADMPRKPPEWHVARFDRAIAQTTGSKAKRLELQRWRDYYAGLADLSKPE